MVICSLTKILKPKMKVVIQKLCPSNTGISSPQHLKFDPKAIEVWRITSFCFPTVCV